MSIYTRYICWLGSAISLLFYYSSRAPPLSLLLLYPSTIGSFTYFVCKAKAEQLISSLQKTENVGRVLFSGRPEKRLQLIIRTQKNGLFLAFPFSGRGSVTRKPGVFSGCDGPSPEKSMGCLAVCGPCTLLATAHALLACQWCSC